MTPDQELNDAALRQLAQQLGARAAEQLDLELTARAVVTRLKQEPRASLRAWVGMHPTWRRIAAALVIVVGAGLVVRGASHRAPEQAALIEPAGADLSDLSADQLQQLLQVVGQPQDQGAVSAQEVGLEELTVPQLRQLLRSLEG